ncbi:hypothetical protein O0235_05305 [Tepidiforma flava]|uniref:Uncharacterized protein n=1 Tax=Tepidiforma flava TaxID=3004094 RepID=A0ABY7M8X6_9CHLR|nr:hypothetical protein [Tepidiforma flava]WBL36983.1 hypothetical protein O0235_05305 [Tepidiforma flava]
MQHPRHLPGHRPVLEDVPCRPKVPRSRAEAGGWRLEVGGWRLEI